MRRHRFLLSLACALGSLSAFAGGPAAQEAGHAAGRNFGAEYATLSPDQKALVDDIYRRFGAITGRELNPEQAYNGARLSVRTTFDAVTHALTTSRLTDAETGEPLGRALDLIDHLETVNGRVEGAGGDRQFRLYVALKPGARELLERSAEFDRKGDNTIFHKGYPLNYRQEGVPSMQISMTRDGTRADIDVDYRSEKFPASLVNGHLTAANSDIRAGNVGRHNQRWEGLVNWWEGLFGRLFSTDSYADESDEDREFPVQPRAGDKTIDVAVYDFLESWLVEGKPNLAVAYVDREALDCLALRLEEEGEELDRGLAVFQLWARMDAINQELGPVDSLEDVIRGVRLFNPNFKLVRQDHHRLFVLQGVPRYLAEQMKCGSFTRVGDLPQVRKVRLGPDEEIRYFLASFYLKGADGRGSSMSLLWEKREGFWRIVSYDTTLETSDAGMPDLHEDVAVAEMDTMEADPAVAAANEAFLRAWFVEKDTDRAMEFLSPQSYACVKLLAQPGDAALETPEEQRARLRLGIQRTGELVGDVDRLEGVIEGVYPWDPRLRRVEHARPQAFGLFGLPNWAGKAAGCRSMVARGGETAPEGTDKGFGRYFASALRIQTLAGEPAVLYLAWEKQDGAWRIFAFKLEEP